LQKPHSRLAPRRLLRVLFRRVYGARNERDVGRAHAEAHAGAAIPEDNIAQLVGQLRNELMREAERQPPLTGLREDAAEGERRKVLKLVDVERIVRAVLLALT
jgi:hypothetical protein